MKDATSAKEKNWRRNTAESLSGEGDGKGRNEQLQREKWRMTMTRTTTKVTGRESARKMTTQTTAPARNS